MDADSNVPHRKKWSENNGNICIWIQDRYNFVFMYVFWYQLQRALERDTEIPLRV